MTEPAGDDKYRTHLRRRFMLIGTTQAAMQVWDTLRAVEAILAVYDKSGTSIHLLASREMGEVAAFAGLFSKSIAKMEFSAAVSNDQSTPDFLNWSRIITPSELQMMLRK